MNRVTALVMSLMLTLYANADAPNLKLPFPPNTSWGITTGYGGSITHQGNDYYAIDFNLAGTADFGRPIIAAAAGTVTTAGWSNGGYGNHVIIDHGDGYTTHYGHLDEIVVSTGEYIWQGQQVGTCGSTGDSSGPHLHFVLNFNGGAAIPEPMSGQTNFHEGGSYLSDNFGLDLVARLPNNGINLDVLDAYESHDCSDVNSHFFLGHVISRQGGGSRVHVWEGTTIQDYEKGVLVQNPLTNNVFPIVGGFFNVWIGAGNPWIFGPPLEAERHGSGWAEQNFQYARFYWDGTRVRVYDLNDNEMSVGISIIPGNGSTLNIQAYAQTPTTAYVSGSAVTGAVQCEVKQGGSVIGTLNPTNLDFTVTGLSPNTTYTFQLVAKDANGNTLATSAIVPVTQPAVPGPQSIQVMLQPRTLSLDASWQSIADVSYYSVSVNGVHYNTFQAPQCTIYNLSNSQTYTVVVQAYSSTGALLASGSASKTLGQNVYIVTYDGPLTLCPNHEHTRTYYLFNDTDDPLYDFVANWSGISSSTPWISLDSNTYQVPTYVAPHSTVELCTVTFNTGADYTLATKVAVSVYFSASCPVPSLSMTSIDRSFQDWMTIVPFTDPASGLPTTMTADAQSVPLTVSNESNSTCAPFRVDAYVDEELAVSIMSPQLAARETWTTYIDFSTLPTGQYNLELVVNADGAVQNIRTDNDTSQCLLTIDNPDMLYEKRYEAEDATLINVAIDTDHMGHSGTGFVDQFEYSGDAVCFSISVPLIGTYRLDFWIGNGNPTPAFRNLIVDGFYIETIKFSSVSTSWDDWGVVSFLVPLSAGSHTIQIERDWMNSGAINLDCLDVIQLKNELRYYEAEDATLTSGAVDTDHINYRSDGFVDQLEGVGDRVNFAIVVTEAGMKRLRFRYGRGSSTPATRNIYVDNAYVHRLTLRGLGSSWDVWGYSDMYVYLEAGTHTISLVHDWMNGGAINLDCLEVLSVPMPVAHIEAEDASLYGLGTDTGHWGYSGTAFVDGFTSSGRGANFIVTIPEYGMYQLVFYYANGVSQNAIRTIYINGQALGDLVLPTMGQDQWDVWAPAVMVVELTEGTHQIGIWYDSGDQAPINLDYLEVRHYPELP